MQLQLCKPAAASVSQTRWHILTHTARLLGAISCWSMWTQLCGEGPMHARNLILGRDCWCNVLSFRIEAHPYWGELRLMFCAHFCGCTVKWMFYSASCCSFWKQAEASCLWDSWVCLPRGVTVAPPSVGSVNCSLCWALKRNNFPIKTSLICQDSYIAAAVAWFY